jgi:cytochrome c peroxidase
MRYFYLICVLLIINTGCEKNNPGEGGLTEIPFSPNHITLQGPEGFPEMDIPVDNPTTMDGVELGRRLFYDPILSDDFTMSCFTCHRQGGSFTDNQAVSFGIDGIAGTRSSMSLLNIGFANEGLFWDGRSETLEDLSILPIEDPIELHTTWEEVESRLQTHEQYPELFRKAFGIQKVEEITRTLAANAISQFMRTLISSGNSKFDRFFRGEVELTDEEYLGYVLFFDLDPAVTDAECGHCHNAPLFTTHQYLNNGIEPVSDLGDFPDMGRGPISENRFDNGRFRVPTLRNVVFTAPYMHDGRFKTLEEVIDHYDSGGNFQENKDPLIKPLRLQPHEKEALISFIMTLTDSSFIADERYKNPF